MPGMSEILIRVGEKNREKKKGDPTSDVREAIAEQIGEPSIEHENINNIEDKGINYDNHTAMKINHEKPVRRIEEASENSQEKVA